MNNLREAAEALASAVEEMKNFPDSQEMLEVRERADAVYAALALPDAQLMSEETVKRHTLTAKECPPNSKVILVSYIKRLHEREADAQPVAIENPWREFIENCMTGDNYFRTSEYRDLLKDLDRLYATPQPAIAPDQMRKYVEDFAKKCGWMPGNSEGAFECIQRVSYAQGVEDGRSRPSATPQPVIDPDALAQEIRRVNGDNKMGAGELAERLVAFLGVTPAPPKA